VLFSATLAAVRFELGGADGNRTHDPQNANLVKANFDGPANP
jgi:hypothetical protein